MITPPKRERRKGVNPVMPSIGTTEIIVIALIVIALFGAKKLPELVRGIAKAIKEFRSASKDDK